MRKFTVYVNGQPFEVIVEEAGDQSVSGQSTGHNPSVSTTQGTSANSPAAPSASSTGQQAASEEKAPPAASGGEQKVEAPMPGSVLEVKVSTGDTVSEGDVLLILEAMKMENEVSAPASGVVKKLNVEKGSNVNTGDVMVIIE